jgi:hypothetical protein
MINFLFLHFSKISTQFVSIGVLIVSLFFSSSLLSFFLLVKLFIIASHSQRCSQRCSTIDLQIVNYKVEM